jgi:hypothetical protein
MNFIVDRKTLACVLLLNHELYTEEVRSGLHRKRRMPRTAPKNKAASTPSKQGPNLLDGKADE